MGEEEADFYEPVDWRWTEEGFRVREALRRWFGEDEFGPVPVQVDDVDREHYMDTIGG